MLGILTYFLLDYEKMCFRTPKYNLKRSLGCLVNSSAYSKDVCNIIILCVGNF